MPTADHADSQRRPTIQSQAEILPLTLNAIAPLTASDLEVLLPDDWNAWSRSESCLKPAWNEFLTGRTELSSRLLHVLKIATCPRLSQRYSARLCKED
jgi:hypothetical protein